MEQNIRIIEERIGEVLDRANFPRHELASENVLAAIQLDLLPSLSVEEERRLLNASILLGNSGLQNIVELVA